MNCTAKLPRQAKDLTGERFGKLTVEAFSHSDKGCWWSVRCDCGATKVMYAATIKRSISCGCSHIDNATNKFNSTGGASLWKRAAYSYKNNARHRGITWDVTNEQFIALAVQPCHYCGSPPSNIMFGRSSERAIRYSGIDRADNTIGYQEGNIVPCCKPCNMAKRDMTTAEFLEWAHRLVAHQQR